VVARARELEGEAAFDATFARGRDWTTEEAVACALESPATEALAA
jgi:hypothetical protein